VYCWNCHAADGKGTASVRGIDSHLPDFTSANFQRSRTDADLTHSILEGKGPLMKSRKEELGTVDVKDMVALVRGFEGGKQVVEMVMPGEGFPVPEGSGSGTGVSAGSGTGSGTGVTDEDTAKKLRMAAFIYQHNCINCHGPDGTGSLMRPTLPEIPNFTNAKFHQTHSNVQLVETVLKGKNKMPAGGGQPVSPEQAENLVAYVRAFAPKGTVIPDTGLSDTDFDKAYKRLLEQYKELQKQFEKGKDKP
jgi:cytochrome c oxidase cbb3-type subunit 3